MPKFKAFHVSEIGASHLKSGKLCQDYSISSSGDEYAVAIVCDGHGGNKFIRSDRGSRIAAEQTLGSINELMRGRFKKNLSGMKIYDLIIEQPTVFLNQLAVNIIFRWREAIKADYLHEPFTVQEITTIDPDDLSVSGREDAWVNAYGTTLIAIVVAKKYWYGIHIGDGKCIAVSEDGEFSQPIPWDDRCFLNLTTSLCDSDASTKFRYFFDKENLPLAVFVGTDGIDDTFGTDTALYNFYQAFLKLSAEKGIEKAQLELKEYLPTLSEKGSKDDISIAGVILQNNLRYILKI